MKCAACNREILGKGRMLDIGVKSEQAIFCEDSLGCQRTVAFTRITPLLAMGATVKTALEALANRNE